MKIRRLQRFDYEDVCDLMIEFAAYTGIDSLRQQTYDKTHAKSLLLKCEHAGLSFVAEDDRGKIQGMLLSLRVPELWIPNVIRLRELAWFVTEPYRNTSVGARLYAQYKKLAEQQRQEGRISGYTITKLSNSPDFDYERAGYKFIEATYLIGA